MATKQNTTKPYVWDELYLSAEQEGLKCVKNLSTETCLQNKG